MKNFSVDTKSVEYKQMEKDCLAYCNYRRSEKDYYNSMCELMAAAYLCKNGRLPEGMVMQLAATDFKNIDFGNGHSSTDLLTSIINRFPLFLAVFKNKCLQSDKSRSGFSCDDKAAEYFFSHFRIPSNKEVSVYQPFSEMFALPMFQIGFNFDCESTDELYVELAKVITNLANDEYVSIALRDSSAPLINTDKVASHKYIFVMPPLNPRDSSYSTSNIIDAIVDSWTEGTRMIVLCLDSFLRDTKNEDFRRLLIENRLVRKVVKLPRNIFSNTGVDTSFIVLENSQPTDDAAIQFVDLSSYRNISDFSSESFAEFEKENTLCISESSLVDSILSPSYRINSFKCGIKLQELENPVALSNLVAFSGSLCRIDFPDELFVITPKDLAEASKMAGSNFNLCEKKAMSAGKSLLKLTEDCLLVSLVGNLNPVFFKYNHDIDYYVDRHMILPLQRVNDSVLDDYLIAELSKPYVERQVSLLSQGVCIFHIRPDNLLNIKVNVPSVDLQHKAVIQYKNDSLSAVAKELIKQKEKEHNDYINEVRMRKHDMMGHLQQLSSARKNLDYYLSHKDNFSDEEFISGMKHEVFNQNEAIESLSLMLEIFSRESQFGTPEKINIDEFLSEHYFDNKNYTIDNDTDYQVFADAGFEIPDEILNPVYDSNKSIREILDESPNYAECLNVKMAKDDLKRLFDNIIGNAIKHGFTDPERNDYQIWTTLTFDKDRKMYRIDVFNNGTPMPKNMDKTRYGLRGEKGGKTAGTGEGGYIVKSIVEHYGGDYEIDSDERGTTVTVFLPIYLDDGN
ncbi:MAG: ATP-binding protein [Paludibacteraceae bacterium]|nr:ATP-binding protein [Paludibacteraceae bacterium]